MKKLKGTETEKNVLRSFAGESQAANRYEFFAKAAKKEGYEQIAAIFMETAANERAHAKQFFRMLEGGEVEITDSYPAGVIGTTAKNLEASMMGETHEYTSMYKAFERTALKEGFRDIARIFRLVAEVEKHHQKRFKKLLSNIKVKKVFRRDAPKSWTCRNCGHTHRGKSAPNKCPLCDHPQAHFEVAAANY